MKSMVDGTMLFDLHRKCRNHSARKTSVRKMKSCGYVNSQITHIAGHSNEKSLEPYELGDETEMIGLSLS